MAGKMPKGEKMPISGKIPKGMPQKGMPRGGKK